jgi:uroporphyrinogen-III synthase
VTTPSALTGRRVGITADRRWRSQADLLEEYGAEVVHGPTIRTVDLSRDEILRTATLSLISRPPQFLVSSTGMGMQMWLEAADDWGLGGALREALRDTRMVARGAKARSALRRFGFDVAWQAPSETMEEVVAFLTAQGVDSARVALQLFDPGGHPSTAALAARCGELVELPVYRWRLPDDIEPAGRLIHAIVGGGIDAVTFTSQPAVHHLFRIAEHVGCVAELRSACNGAMLTICVGPVCAEAARDEGITRPLWPDPPRLSAMVRLVVSELAGPRGASANLPRGNDTTQEDRADGRHRKP